MSTNEKGKITIRPETKNDFAEIYEVNKLAFGQENEAKLVNALRKGTSFVPGLSLVAVAGGKVVGHILFTKIKIRNKEGIEQESLALAPLSVRPEMQHQGIGGQLIRHGLAKARGMGYPSVIVLGHEHYYPKFGFIPAIKWGIQAPFEVPLNALMGIELTECALENISGTVVYPKEFEGV